MKKIIFIFFIVTAVIQAFAGEIPNTIGAVKNAEPGDYIVLKDGSHYVLVEEEIAIVNNEFDFNDNEALRENSVPRSDGGIEFNITSTHKRIIWPDGKSMDVLTTRRAFDAYIRFLAANYDPIPFTMYGSVVGNTYPESLPEGLETFRGKVYRTFVTDGVVTLEIIEAKEYNRSTVGDGLKRGFQMKDGTLIYTLTGGGNFRESGTRRDE
jgi:hypothetical protein